MKSTLDWEPLRYLGRSPSVMSAKFGAELSLKRTKEIFAGDASSVCDVSVNVFSSSYAGTLLAKSLSSWRY
jgi:hypothetical protein